MTRGRRWTRIVTTACALALAAGCGGAPAKTATHPSKSPSFTPKKTLADDANLYPRVRRALAAARWVEIDQQENLPTDSDVAPGALLREHTVIAPEALSSNYRLLASGPEELVSIRAVNGRTYMRANAEALADSGKLGEVVLGRQTVAKIRVIGASRFAGHWLDITYGSGQLDKLHRLEVKSIAELWPRPELSGIESRLGSRKVIQKDAHGGRIGGYVLIDEKTLLPVRQVAELARGHNVSYQFGYAHERVQPPTDVLRPGGSAAT